MIPPSRPAPRGEGANPFPLGGNKKGGKNEYKYKKMLK